LQSKPVCVSHAADVSTSQVSTGKQSQAPLSTASPSTLSRRLRKQLSPSSQADQSCPQQSFRQ
jgi:hypothetical protein